MKTKYPIYVISKGRWGKEGLTARFLRNDGVPFKLVIEPQEQEQYAAEFGEENLLLLPFSNLGLGSIPARNWVWEHSLANGDFMHWILDDNMRRVYKRHKGLRLPCESGPAFLCIEEFVDRYENIAIAGMAYKMFVPDFYKIPPFWHNVHVYSCLLIRNDLPFRWRGRYNEDTDLCLQVLSGGWCTVLINAFCIDKVPTMTTKGGNTDELYAGDGRLKMARALERQWPYMVSVNRRFQRPQHIVRDNWKHFDTPLIKKSEAVIPSKPNAAYEMELTVVDPTIKSARLQKIVAETKQKSGVSKKRAGTRKIKR